jgi:hypothetical protein
VNEWAGVFLAVMAVALVAMAAVQIGLMVVGLRVAKQMATTTAQLQEEIRPLLEKAHLIADDASRAAALAVIQVERVDRFMASTATRLDTTLGIIQNVVSGPIGKGAAAVSAFRAVMGVVRDWKGRRRRQGHDDDDALFVG